MQKVLVTGAGGFLGGWVVESFLIANIPVQAGVRRWNSAVRIARRPVNVVECDILDPDQLHAAMEGCDGVVHCAVGNDEVTINGTRNVLAAARQRRVRRVVHLSSVAVYGRASGRVEESHPLHGRGNPYAQRKIAAEQVCQEFSDSGVPVVILRPSIIYGPFSDTWTVSFAKRLASGKWGTFGGAGAGRCNLVYVTDVVQAIHRALSAGEDVVGAAFNINGNDIVTWNDFFVRFNHALKLDSLRPLRAWPIAWKARLLAPVRTVGRYALTNYGDAMLKLHARSSLAAKYMRATETSLKLTPTNDQLKTYGLDVEYVIDKAKAELGYDPQVNADQGLDYCAAWAKQQGIVP